MGVAPTGDLILVETVRCLILKKMLLEVPLKKNKVNWWNLECQLIISRDFTGNYLKTLIEHHLTITEGRPLRPETLLRKGKLSILTNLLMILI